VKLFKTQTRSSKGSGKPTIPIVVELFGNARLLAGRDTIDIVLPLEVSTSEVARHLAEAEPTLVGEVIRPEGGLISSYILNLNGASFLSDSKRRIRIGDRILLFSSQAGG
jgi:molybdopterin converting factor small subunit